MTKTPILCNQTYTIDHQGTQRACQTGTPQPAAYKRLGMRVCIGCWPEVVEAMRREHGKGAPEALFQRALKQTFKQVR